MSFQHNAMAQIVSQTLLTQVRTGTANSWCVPRLTSKCILWQGIADWPRPDIAFEDPSTDATIALEFKPPNHSKREYVTGLGQMLTYLESFEFAGLVLPERSTDGFPIAEHIAGVIDRELDDRPLMLMSYGKSVGNLKVHRGLKLRSGPKFKSPKRRGKRTFWAYWRDLSNYDLFALLSIIDSNPGATFETSYDEFWNSIRQKRKARTWEGTPRKKSKSATNKSDRINAQYSLRHCRLVSADGGLTLPGLTLLHVGKVYGPDSDAFLSELARSVLLDGNHLELILWIEERSREVAVEDKQLSDDFLNSIDQALVAAGVIRPPKNEGSGKPHFFRDEVKLWNKLGLLHTKSGQYFFPGEGFRFDWRAIVSSARGGAD